ARRVHAAARLDGTPHRLFRSCTSDRTVHQEHVPWCAGIRVRPYLLAAGQVLSSRFAAFGYSSSSPETIASTFPASTWSPTATEMSVTTPSAVARIACSIFMASIDISAWPALTVCPLVTSTEMIEPGIGDSRDPSVATRLGSS